MKKKKNLFSKKRKIKSLEVIIYIYFIYFILDVLFIGELFILNVIPKPVISIVTYTLLEKFLNDYLDFQKGQKEKKNFENHIEGIIKLFYQSIYIQITKIIKIYDISWKEILRIRSKRRRKNKTHKVF